ncbi:hypothetical protein COO60DRAFT_1127976 [Scenedesmus sp. NREL 46B-D3]|nr:hypothetical protein COO60DRAFT_1127976 [Scenedesmus sp. NREL 46B-D3]
MDAHSFIQDSPSNSTLGQQQQEPGVLNSVLQHALQSQLGINMSQETSALGRLGSQVLHGTAAIPSHAADAGAGAGAATPPAGASESAAAEAERHRLSDTQMPDLEAIVKWIEGMLPFLLILAAVFVYHFCTGIFLFIWLLWSLVKANQLMRKLAVQPCASSSSGSSSSKCGLVAGALYIAMNAALVGWLTSGQRLYQRFLLQPPEGPISVWQAAFLVLVTDSLVRFCGLAPKLLLVAAAQSWWQSGSGGSGRSSRSSRSGRRQARLLTLVEYVVTVYRALVPIPVWYTYLLTCTLNGVLSSLLAGFYLTFKGWGLLRQGQLLLVATKLLLRSGNGALVGTYLKDYVGRADGCGEGHSTCCPICQEPADAAVRLDCSHIFCEDCISEWLTRDKAATCPMCRAEIQPPGLECFGDGATSLLPCLF